MGGPPVSQPMFMKRRSLSAETAPTNPASVATRVLGAAGVRHWRAVKDGRIEKMDALKRWTLAGKYGRWLAGRLRHWQMQCKDDAGSKDGG